MDVYVDLLFLVNLGLNTWALWLSSSLIGQRLRFSHLISSGVLGAIYGLGLVTPWAAYFSHPICKLLLAMLMVQLAFRPTMVARLLQLSGLFLLVSFATAGCVLGIQCLMLWRGTIGKALAYGRLSPWTLLLAVLCLGLGSHRIVSFLENRLVHVANRASIEFVLEDARLSLLGLVDSGNQLIEPLSGRPVVIVALDAVSSNLPAEAVALAATLSDNPESLTDLTDQPWLARIRLIPYHSVGKRSGVLLGWRVDEIKVTTAHGSHMVHNVTLAIAEHQFSERNAYQALVPERLLPAITKSIQEVH